MMEKLFIFKITSLCNLFSGKIRSGKLLKKLKQNVNLKDTQSDNMKIITTNVKKMMT